MDELKEIEGELKQAREVGPSYETFQRLARSEIPTLEAEIEKLEGRRKVLLGQVDEHDVKVTQKQMEKKEVEALTKTVQTIGKYEIEIRQLESQIEDLSAQQRESTPLRSLEKIQEELGASAEEARTLKNAISKLMAEKERGRAQITKYELELRDHKVRLADASHQLEIKATLAGRVDECRAMAQAQQQAIEQHDREIESLEPAFAKARAQYDDVSNRGADLERDLQHEASKLSDSVHQLSTSDQEINAYIDKSGPHQLERCQRELEHVRTEIDRLEKEQKDVTVTINKARKQLDHQGQTKATISGNLRYRRDLRALEAVKAEIAALEAKNAEVDRDRFTQEADRMGKRHRELSAHEAEKMGEMKSKDKQLEKLLDDWETDYKDAAKNFKEAHIKVETTKAAVEDLKRFWGALDK